MKKFLKFITGFLMLPVLLGLFWVLFNIPRAGDIFVVFVLLMACTACGASFMESGPIDFD